MGEHLDRRECLRLALMLMVAIGLLFVAYVFLDSLALGDRQRSVAVCDLAGLAPGELRRCRPGIAVYRRSERDKEAVDRFLTLLVDPDSRESLQPEGARNHWRSHNPDYFVFYHHAPIRLCQVELRQAGEGVWPEAPEAGALYELPYLYESCDGRSWDVSGRLYRRDGVPPERNLIVPEVEWIDGKRVAILGR